MATTDMCTVSLRSFRREFLFISVFSAGFLLCILTSTAKAGTSPSVDLAGVRIGMTRDQAVAALKASDPGGSFQDTRPNERSSSFASIWEQNPDIIFVSSDFHKIGSLPWEQTALLGSCPLGCEDGDHKQYLGLLRSNLDSPKVVAIWFSPTKATESVIAISSDTVFMKSIPTADGVRSALIRKYTNTPTIETVDPTTDLITWQFDARGRPILHGSKSMHWSPVTFLAFRDANDIYDCVYSRSGGARKPESPQCPIVYLPSTIRDGDGVSLVAAISKGATICNGIRSDLLQDYCSPENQNPLLATNVSLMLFDSTALARYRDEVVQATDAAKAAKDKAAAAGAKSSGDIKF
jgi:hypothetical protein